MIRIYKASAGSGKTFTLAREYIKLILGHKDETGTFRLNRKGKSGHRTVLAITFTNKATEEMKSRIIHELAVIAGLEKGWEKESPYADYLCGLFSCTRDELRESAGNALRDLLYDFNFFSVSTIDSFFQTILRSFAREAEVAGNYELELNDEAIIGMSVDRLLQDLNHGDKTKRSTYLINWLSSYMTQLIEDGLPFNVFNRSLPIHKNLIQFINKITDDVYRANEDRLLEYLSDEKRFCEFKDKIYSCIREIQAQTSRACKEAIEYIESSGYNEIVKAHIFNALKKWSEKGYINDGLNKTILEAADDITKAYKKLKKGQPTPNGDLDGVIMKALEMMAFSNSQVKTLRIIATNLYQLGLLASLSEYIDKFRRENSTILLSDTNALISRIIGSDDTPFLYERVGLWFRHYLIDEFQDTSLSQWANIRPLISESLSQDNDNLVIGDEKQCIYRFRNSDPSLLHNLHDEPIATGRSEIHGENIAENTNWRSSADVIRFNNTFFLALVKIVGCEGIYSNVAQQISPKHHSHHGYVKVKAYKGKKKEDWIPEALDNLTLDLKRQLLSGYKPGDIAILVRKRDEGNTIIHHLEEILRIDPDFPRFRIVSDSSLLLSSSPSVGLIISRLRLISATDFVTTPKKKTRREVASIISSFEDEKSRGLSSSEALSRALDRHAEKSAGVSGNPTHSENEITENSVDLISLVESIIEKYIPEQSRSDESLYIAALQDCVTEFVGRGHCDIRSFLYWWDEKGFSTPVAGAQDDTALNILTIHKSKGLEYPCVHIPFADMTESNRPEPAWFEIDHLAGISDDIMPPMLPLELSSAMRGTPFEARYEEVNRQRKLDNVNLLYVAFTRAVNELCVGYPETGGTSKNMSADIAAAIEMCRPDFCDNIELSHGKEGNSLFTPLEMIDGTLILGAPTRPVVKKEEKSALKPGELLDMGEYFTYPQRDIWGNTKLEDKYYNIEEARERGILLHDTMSTILTPKDIHSAINSLRHSKKAKELSAVDIAEIQSIITERVTDPRAQRWFINYFKVFVERPVSVGGDDSLRPDRIVWTEDGFIDIVDYKTGTQKPEKYFKKIRQYIDILERTGYDNVRGFLYYLDTGQIVEVMKKA